MKGVSDFLDVELFLIANGRLPNQSNDKLTRDMIISVLDKRDNKSLEIRPYAFHRLGLMSCKGGESCPNHEEHS